MDSLHSPQVKKIIIIGSIIVLAILAIAVYLVINQRPEVINKLIKPTEITSNDNKVTLTLPKGALPENVTSDQIEFSSLCF